MTTEFLRGKRRVGGLDIVKTVVIGFGLLLAPSAAATFTQLESIQADGHVWIYSGFKPTCTDRVEITFKASSGSTATLYCSRGTSTSTATFTAFIVRNGGNTIRLDRNTSISGPYVEFSLDEIHTLVVDGSLQTKCTIDNVSIEGDLASGDFTPVSAFSLFASHKKGSALSESTALSDMDNFGTHTLYAFKVYSADGTLVADMVPARDDDAADGTTAQYGLFDRIGHSFHKGLGTGTFTPGAQVGETGGLGRLATTCTWIGSAGGKWSNAGNWANGIRPEPGLRDMLLFDLTDGDIDCENDIEGLVITRLVTTNGTSSSTFTLRGKGLTITEGDRSNNASGSFVGSSKVYCYAPLTLTGDEATIDSVNGVSYFYGGLTLTGANFYFRGGKDIYFYDNPVVGRNTVFQSGGSNMTCYFYAPLKVKKFIAGIKGCSGYGYFYCTGNEWEQTLVYYYGVLVAQVENAFPTNTVFEWYKDYDYADVNHYRYYIYADQICDRISQPEPFTKDGVILGGAQIQALNSPIERTLILRGTDNALAYCRLVNNLSLVWDPVGAFTQTFADREHPTTGTLTVKGGTLASAGTNRFANVTCLKIHDGATFAVVASSLNAAANPFTGNTDLDIIGTGKVSVPSGVTVTFANTLVRGVLQSTGTYQALDGTDASAEKVGWVTGAGIVQVTCNGTSWTADGTGAWGNPDNWSHGLPSGYPSGVVYLTKDGATYTAEMAATDAWPQKLVLRGAGAKLCVKGDVFYDGTGKTTDCLVKDGAVIRVDDGADLMLTNFVGSFVVESSVAATSKIEVASGRFCYAPKKDQNYPLLLKQGGAVDACGGVFQAPGSTYRTVDMQGGTILASGDGAVTYAGDGKSNGSVLQTGTAIFSGNSSFSWGGAPTVLIYPNAVGETLYVSYRDHARQASSADNCLIGGNNEITVTNIITIVEYASDATHAKFGNRVRVRGGGTGYAELRISDGVVPIGGRGLDIGEAYGTLTKSVDGRLVFSGGTVNDDGSNGAWADQSKQNGFAVGYAANATCTLGRIVKGTVSMSGGTFNVNSGVTLVGTGYAVGRYLQTGGTLNHKATTQVFGIGQAGGEGWFVQSNGTLTVSGPAYIGGFWTNILSSAEKSPWPTTLHDAEGTMVFAGGTASFKKGLVLGADGRGTLVREGSAGTFTVTGDLVLSNTVESAASGGTLKFVYAGADGIAPIAVSGKLVIRDGAKIEVDLGDYGTQPAHKSKRYLLTAAGGIEGDLANVDITITGSVARGTVVNADAGGIFASVPKGLMILLH